MESGSGCTLARYSDRERVRYGDEVDDWGAVAREPCHDCAVLPGQFHHLNCDLGRCRDCGGQEHDGVC